MKLSIENKEQREQIGNLAETGIKGKYLTIESDLDEDKTLEMPNHQSVIDESSGHLIETLDGFHLVGKRGNFKILDIVFNCQENNPDVIEFDLIELFWRYYKKGIAQKYYKFMEDYLNSLGIKKISAFPLSNEGYLFCKKMGFKPKPYKIIRPDEDTYHHKEIIINDKEKFNIYILYVVENQSFKPDIIMTKDLT